MTRQIIIILLVSALLFSFPAPHRAWAQGGTWSTLYVSPLRTWNSTSFSINVSLNLTSAESIGGYDVLLRYNSSVLKAQSIVVGNLFAPSQTRLLVDCINGGSGIPAGSPGGINCDITRGDGAGVVHSAAVITPPIVNGTASGTLFSVQLAKVGNGTSLLEIFNDQLINPFSQVSGQTYINSHVFPHLTYDGVYSNRGLAALFNIIKPPILVVGEPLYFDGSGSFNPANPNNSNITRYVWNFDDGTTNTTAVSSIFHSYSAMGNYNVTLTVTDSKGFSANVTRTIVVGSALGGLRLIIFDSTGRDIQTNVTISLYRLANTNALVETQIKTPASRTVVFSNLVAGNYRVDFSGGSVASYSRVEAVIPGWTVQDSLFLSLKIQTPAYAPDYGPLVFVGVLAAGLSLGVIGIVHRRRSDKRK